MRLLLVINTLLFVTLSAQSVRMGIGTGKVLLVTPMVGVGTMEDPKRPAFVRESGVPFRYQLSDDGTMALVEAMPRNLAESARLESLVKNDARAKIFRPEKDKKSDIEAEFKRLKKDFDPESFGQVKAKEAGK
jgi:hypothetical protein